MAAGGRNTICTIFKDLALPHKTKYVAAAVRFQGQWVFIRSRSAEAYEMIGGLCPKQRASRDRAPASAL